MGRTVAREVTNRNDVRAEIAAGGWEVVWGDLINEGDLLTFIISIPTGTVAGWVSQQVEAQVVKFQQSLKDVSEDVVQQAIDYLDGLMKHNRKGEADISGLGVKGGFATYQRHMEYYLWGRKIGSHALPNNHQPYIAIRITKALPTHPPKTVSVGRETIPRDNLGDRMLLTNATMREGDYLTSSNGQYQLILQGDGNLVIYGPGHAVVWEAHIGGIGEPPFRLVAQSDRNIVIYHTPAGNVPLWHTHTSVVPDRPGCFFVMQSDRNLVLYEPGANGPFAVWNSHTSI